MSGDIGWKFSSAPMLAEPIKNPNSSEQNSQPTSQEETPNVAKNETSTSALKPNEPTTTETIGFVQPNVPRNPPPALKNYLYKNQNVKTTLKRSVSNHSSANPNLLSISNRLYVNPANSKPTNYQPMHKSGSYTSLAYKDPLNNSSGRPYNTTSYDRCTACNSVLPPEHSLSKAQSPSENRWAEMADQFRNQRLRTIQRTSSILRRSPLSQAEEESTPKVFYPNYGYSYHTASPKLFINSRKR